MDFLRHYLLAILIFLPAVGAIPVLILRRRSAIRWTALGIVLATFCASLLAATLFDWRVGSSYAYAEDGGVVQLVERADWINAWGIQYLVGLDGLNLPMIVLTTFMCVVTTIAAWKTRQMTRGYFALLLLLETTILGTFLSLDFFLFYVFLLLSLAPVYVFINIWGGARREYAAVKFFIYMLVGSIALLVVLIWLHLYSQQIVPGGTFDLIRMASPDFQQKLVAACGGANGNIARLFFLLLLGGFFIRLPAFPLHGWLADAQSNSPAPIRMLLTALLTKTGGYAILRVAYPLFPQTAKTLWLIVAVIGVVSLLWGALCALAQRNLERLIAHSCLSRMGLFTLGVAMLTGPSLNGAILMLVADGIISAALLFIADIVVTRTGQRELSQLGGIANRMPLCGGFGIATFFAQMGLPGFCGFVPEVMILLGAFAAATRTLGIIACGASLLTAGYLLSAMQRVFFGPARNEQIELMDLDEREIGVLTPLMAVMVLLGVVPWPTFFIFTNQTVAAMLKLFW